MYIQKKPWKRLYTGSFAFVKKSENLRHEVKRYDTKRALIFNMK